MSDLRQVDRVMLEKIARIETHLDWINGGDNEWKARTKTTRDLLTEQDEAGEQITLCAEELNLVRQWFNSVDDTTPDYLEAADFVLARRMGFKPIPEPVEQPSTNILDSTPSGLYRVHWKTGGTSLAAVGITRDGGRWLAPTNWVLPTVRGGSNIARMEPLFDEPAAPQPGLSDDSVERISLAVRLQQAEEKLARLEGLVRDYLTEVNDKSRPFAYEVNAKCGLQTYLDKLAAGGGE